MAGLEIGRMGRDPRKFRSQHVVETSSKGHREKNPVSGKHGVFHRVQFSDSSIRTPGELIVACIIQNFMSLRIPEFPKRGNQLPPSSDRRKRTNGRCPTVRICPMDVSLMEASPLRTCEASKEVEPPNLGLFATEEVKLRRIVIGIKW